MAFAKSNFTKIGTLLVYLYFILFPFGQLLRRELYFGSTPITFHPLDLVVGLVTPLMIMGIFRPHPTRKHFVFFWSAAVFSLILASLVYPLHEILRGSLYLVRFISYYFFFEIVWNLSSGIKEKRKFVNILLISLLFTAFFGWFQYIVAPDLRYLKIFNWDDHYYRLAGTILDPGFMGILMAFGFLISLSLFMSQKSKWFAILSLIFLMTCLFTYARASILALAGGIFLLLFLQKKISLFLITIIAISALIFLLPKGEGEGVNLLRTNSIFQKWENYGETSQIFLDAPLFGVGFNTLCSERIRRFENDHFASHACSGSDSSLLFVFATTGVLGGFIVFSILLRMKSYLSNDMYSKMFIVNSTALLIHSMFLNSLFYPWVLGIMAVLLGLGVTNIKENTKQ